MMWEEGTAAVAAAAAGRVVPCDGCQEWGWGGGSCVGNGWREGQGGAGCCRRRAAEPVRVERHTCPDAESLRTTNIAGAYAAYTPGSIVSACGQFLRGAAIRTVCVASVLQVGRVCQGCVLSLF